MRRQRPREKLPRPTSEDGGELQTKFPGAFLGNSLTQRASNHCADVARFLEASMDDYGNWYQDWAWATSAEEYAYSMNPYGGFGCIDELLFVAYREDV